MGYPAGVATFWAEPTGRRRRWLRRWAHWPADSGAFDCASGYHAARRPLRTLKDHGEPSGDTWRHKDPRWPTSCDKGCGYTFNDGDHWQLFTSAEYGAPGHEPFVLGEAPPGAMWDARWMPDDWHGDDGIALAVVLPDGTTWLVDGQASNCTKPKDREHHCWIRHGDPRTEPVTVDKDGRTCEAGAGSIMSGDYHGFLRAGVFEP